MTAPQPHSHPDSDVPQRIQLRRVREWRKPQGAIVVARPTRWGNPFAVYRGHASVIGRPWFTATAKPLHTGVFIYRAGDDVLYSSHSHVDDAVAHTVELFRSYCTVRQRDDPAGYAHWLEPLRGHNLACWCPLDQPCHADVLLKIANRAVEDRDTLVLKGIEEK